jgi:hypothetical protein
MSDNGEIEIELWNMKEGELQTVILKPTLRAAKMISRQRDGYMGASQAIMQMNFDAYVQIIATAMGLTEKGAEDMADRVYKTGLSGLAAPLIQFIRNLANGGKPPVDKELADEKKSDPLE